VRDDELIELLKADHVAARSVMPGDDFVHSVLRRVAKQGRRRSIVLNSAAILGAAVAALQIPRLSISDYHATINVDLSLLFGSLAIAATAVVFSWTISR